MQKTPQGVSFFKMYCVVLKMKKIVFKQYEIQVVNIFIKFMRSWGGKFLHLHLSLMIKR